MFTLVFVDDREDQFGILNETRREASDFFNISTLLPDPDPIVTKKKIIKQNPDLLLLDYRLDEQASDGETIVYKANPLAQLLRDDATENLQQDFPIFAVSNEDNFRKYFDLDQTAHDLFDRTYNKTDIINRARFIAIEMNSYVETYKNIIELQDVDKKVVHLLDLQNHEDFLVDHRFVAEIDRKKVPHVISMEFYRIFIERPWLLLDEDNLLALLGISPESKGEPEYNKLLQILVENNLGYSGSFSSAFKRYWPHRIRIFFKSNFSVEIGDLNSRERASMIKDTLSVGLKPATSRWTKGKDTYTSFACCSCKQPTEADFAVAAYDPVALPKQAGGSKRICWACIQTGEYSSKNLSVDESDEFIAEKIMNGELKFT